MYILLYCPLILQGSLEASIWHPYASHGCSFACTLSCSARFVRLDVQHLIMISMVIVETNISKKNKTALEVVDIAHSTSGKINSWLIILICSDL